MWITGRLLEEAYTWQTIFAGYSIVGIVWSIGFYLYFRTYPREHPSVNEAERRLIEAEAHPDLLSSSDSATQTPQKPAASEKDLLCEGEAIWLRMLMSPGMWGVCVQSFFRAAGYAFFVTWFFAFLEYAYGISKEQAGLLNSLPLIAVVIGSLTGGVIVDRLLKTTGSRWASRTGTAVVALVLSGVLTMASAWTETATQLSVVIALGALFSGIGSPAAWAATIDLGGRHTAVAMGVMNMAGCLAGVVLPSILGEWFQEIRQSGGDWNAVIYLHAGFYFAGAASWLIVNPNREI